MESGDTTKPNFSKRNSNLFSRTRKPESLDDTLELCQPIIEKYVGQYGEDKRNDITEIVYERINFILKDASVYDFIPILLDRTVVEILRDRYAINRL